MARAPSSFGYGRQRESLVIVAGLVGSTQMSWMSVVPVLPFYARSLGASLSQVGLVLTMFGTGRLLVNLPAGRLCEVRSPRVIMLVAVIANAGLGAAAGFASHFDQLLALRFLTGLAGGAAITAAHVLIAALTVPSSRARALSMVHSTTLAAAAIGPGLGGVVASAFGPPAAFWSSGVVAMCLAGWALLRLPSTPPRAVGQEPAEDEEPSGGPSPWSLGALGPVVAVCTVGFAVFFVRFGQQALLPLVGDIRFGIGPGALGVALSVVGVTNIGLVAVVGGISDRVGRRRVILPSLLALATACGGFALAPNSGLFYVTIVVVGTLMAFNGPTPVAYLADVVRPTAFGRAVGLYRTCGDLAGLVAPVALTSLLAASGVAPAVTVLMVVSAAAATVFWRFAPETVSPAPVA